MQIIRKINFIPLSIVFLLLAPAQLSWAGGDEGDAQRGQVLFESDLGCSVCHGMDALGSIGPNIRQVSIEQVYHAVQNFPDMINWNYNNPEIFEEQALLDIVAYLATLEREPATP